MAEELDLYTGTLLYKDINFTFAFDRGELRLIPPKDKEQNQQGRFRRHAKRDASRNKKVSFIRTVHKTKKSTRLFG